MNKKCKAKVDGRPCKNKANKHFKDVCGLHKNFLLTENANLMQKKLKLQDQLRSEIEKIDEEIEKNAKAYYGDIQEFLSANTDKWGSYKLPEGHLSDRFSLFGDVPSLEAKADIKLLELEYENFVSERNKVNDIGAEIIQISRDRNLDKKARYEQTEAKLKDLVSDFGHLGIRDTASRDEVFDWLEDLGYENNKIVDWYHNIL